MPFTLAHPIAALPLWWGSRHRLDLPALMVGSLVPDITYYLHLQPRPNIGHTLPGILQEGLPWGLALLLVGEYLLKFPCLKLLPRPLMPSVGPYRLWSLSRFLMVVASLALGAVSHIVWDSFTHQWGWSVVQWPWLMSTVGPLPLYAWLQYSGGVFGLLGLALWGYLSWTASLPEHPNLRAIRSAPRKLWITALSSITVLVLYLTYTAVTLPYASNDVKSLVVRAVIGIVSGGSLGLLLYATVYWLWFGMKRLRQ